MHPESNAFGCVMVLVIVVCLCLGAYVLASMVGNNAPKPLVAQSATTTCIGLMNWNSCNITQANYRPPRQDGMSPDIAAVMIFGAVLGAIFLATVGGKE